jgi:23S rRNA (adenine2503-C2)-methyltransferase
MLKLNPEYTQLGRFLDNDGTEKFVFNVEDEGVIEITWIKNKPNIAVFCLPTHYYCNLGCKFCHLTDARREDIHMTSIKSVHLHHLLMAILSTYTKNKTYLISFMGVGEPFLNMDLVLGLYNALAVTPNIKISFAVASMLITLKPFSLLDEKFIAKEVPIKLHFSLHSPIDEIRKDIIPKATATVRECLDALTSFSICASQRENIRMNMSAFHQEPHPAEIHYTLIQGVNDSDRELREMVSLGRHYHIPLKLIKFNPTSQLKRSTKENYWLEVLKRNYTAPVSAYSPPGPNIGSSCGQFTKHYYLGSNTPSELLEFNEWRKKYEVEF